MTTDVFERRVISLVGIALAGYLVYLLAPILTPFIAAFLLAYLGDPLADRLENIGMPRTLAVAVVFTASFVAILVLFLLILPLVNDQVGALAERVPQAMEAIKTKLLPWLSTRFGLEFDWQGIDVKSILSQYGGQLSNVGASALAVVSKSQSIVSAVLLNLLLVPILTFYLLRDWDKMMPRVKVLIPAKQRDLVVAMAKESDRVLSGFLRGQFLVMLALTALYVFGLYIAGVDYALAIGVVAGVVSFVPYLGPIIGIGLAGLTAFGQGDGWIPIIGVGVVFGLGQVLESTFLTPKLVGDRIGLHPVAVIFAVMAGGQLLGFFGVLLALPAASVISAVLRLLNQHLSSSDVAETSA